MKKYLFLIFLISVYSNILIAQSNDTLIGKIIDVSSNSPLQGVNIYNQTSNLGTSSESNGSFNIQIKEFPSIIIFSFIGYENYFLEIKEPPKESIIVKLKQSSFGLPEVEITDQPIIEELSKDNYTVKDFILDGENILLLTYKNFGSNNKLKLTNWEGEVLNEIEIEKAKVDQLRRSCLGNIHLIGEKNSYEISIIENSIQLISKYSSQKYRDLIEPCVETSDEFIYRRVFRNRNQFLTYNIISKKGKNVVSKIFVIDRENLSRSKDDFRLRLGFGADFPRPLTWEQAKAWQSLVYKPLFSPLKNMGEELCLFNHTLGYLKFYSFQGENKRIIPITYHEHRKWQKLILQDEEKNKVYTVYDKRKGKMIYEINLKNGTAIPTLFVETSLVEKMIVHRGHLFYLESGATIAEKNRVLHRVKLN